MQPLLQAPLSYRLYELQVRSTRYGKIETTSVLEIIAVSANNAPQVPGQNNPGLGFLWCARRRLSSTTSLIDIAVNPRPSTAATRAGR